MSDTAADNRAKMQDIRRRFVSGVISYDQAKAEAEPIIAAVNERAKEIAKKHNQRPTKLSFAAIMR
jgi:hypothetical protein